MALKCEPLDSGRAKAIRHDLDIFEARYGVRSEDLETAFMHGRRLNETEDYQEWRFLWSVWQRWTRANHDLVKG